MSPIVVVFIKECKDILRDMRALITVTLVSMLAGPIVLLMIANKLAHFESTAERRIVVISGLAHAPSFANYLARETAQIESAPRDYEQALKDGRITEPVLVLPKDFEAKWQAGQPLGIKIVTSSTNTRANAGVARVKRWIQGFSNERTALYFAAKGVAYNMQDLIEIDEVDLANPKAESIKIFGMLPYFLVFAALYSVWGSALDTTVGEKERGTIEPLIITHVNVQRLILAKWLAVSSLGALITALVTLSFIPAQAMMKSDTLQAMFNYQLYEAWLGFWLLLPLTGFLAAALMMIGCMAKNMRQAQGYSTLLMLVCAFLPMAIPAQDLLQASWIVHLPVLSQHTNILAMLQGEGIQFISVMLSILTCLTMVWLLTRVGAKWIDQS
jgi:sodium transport system permease protein